MWQKAHQKATDANVKPYTIEERLNCLTRCLNYAQSATSSMGMAHGQMQSMQAPVVTDNMIHEIREKLDVIQLQVGLHYCYSYDDEE